MRLFIAPLVVSALALVAVWWWGGVAAFILALLLSVLEVTLSFDNAVVNAKVLSRMSALWQHRFLTWGILLAVFGTRFMLPAVIVSAATMLSPLAVVLLAFQEPAEYARLLGTAGPAISAFGGTFLLMVSLKYFFDVNKTVHWINSVERHLVRWGNIEAIEIALALLVLLSVSFAASASSGHIIAAGCIGLVLFIIMQGIANSLEVENGAIAKSGMALFVYLNILDAAFSLDGVIGAFALTTAIPIIFVGLGIGAYFVRSITVFLVHNNTLDALPYLEHGAHWAIAGLALSMFVGLVVHVPEAIIGTIGLVFVLFSYISSRRALVLEKR